MDLCRIDFMFHLGLKLQGQRPRNGEVSPSPSLPIAPTMQLTPWALSHTWALLYQAVSRAHWFLTEPGLHQTHIPPIWQGFPLRHPSLGFKERNSPFHSPDRLSLSSSRLPLLASVEKLGLVGWWPHFSAEVVSPASLCHSSPTPECSLLDPFVS